MLDIVPFIDNIIFLALFILSIFFFIKNLRKIIHNIGMGKPLNRSNNKLERLKTMIRVALGQSKMTTRPIAAILHLIVYLGFVIINIELLEIIIDGIFGTHRCFSFLGVGYGFLIGSFEILAFLVLVACVLFLIRRNLMKIKRFWNDEMKGWPTSDANMILIFEILLMSAFLLMNAADYQLQLNGHIKYHQSSGIIGAFPISAYIPLELIKNDNTLVFVERFCWWFHIVGILGFLNYLVISKHLHIIFAFPNTYFSNLKPKGQFTNMSSVTKEVRMMLDPSIDPFTQPSNDTTANIFGAKDATDLTWVQLLNAYSCTECGRCTSECPANVTGKKLSPRKIMMDVRDRITQIGEGVDKYGSDFNDKKSLLGDFITPEELWACTSCNACVEACPLNIDPLSIIIDLRRYLVMEKSEAPAELNSVFTNIENNGAPWQFPGSDRLKWKDDE